MLGSNDGTKRTTMHLFQVGQEGEDGAVAERNEEDTMVGQGREGSIDSHFLSSTRATRGNEDTGVLASEGALTPEATGSIPESLCCS